MSRVRGFYRNSRGIIPGLNAPLMKGPSASYKEF